MLLTRLLSHKIKFYHIETKQTVEMASVNYVLSPFEGNTNTGYPKGIKLHPQATNEIYKETDNLDISVSNKK